MDNEISRDLKGFDNATRIATRQNLRNGNLFSGASVNSIADLTDDECRGVLTSQCD